MFSGFRVPRHCVRQVCRKKLNEEAKQSNRHLSLVTSLQLFCEKSSFFRLLRSFNWSTPPSPKPRNDLKCGGCFSLFTFHVSTFKAFTLAEILIVLGIIGIIAEVTIPDLIQQTNNQIYTTSLKKVLYKF